MRIVLSTILVIFGLLGAVPATTAWAQTATPPDQSGAFAYKPPLRGAPARRVGGATRGSGDTGLVLNVLAPEQTGLTTQAQPSLYWFASKPTTTTIELTVISDTAELPVLTSNITVTPGGVQSIDLARHGVTLAPDTDYEWFVSVVQDPGQRSKDVTSGGTIRRIAADPALLARIAAAGERERPRIYAEAGLWYDAVAALSRLIERNPSDTELLSWRAALLDQIGLPAVAAYDRAPTR
jgi:hypothetical protein